MSPRQHDVVQATMGLVDAVLRGINRVVEIGIVLEGVRINVLL